MNEFKTIPLSEIRADKNQPRKFFDPGALNELTESVKSKGVLQPVMVRPNGKGYILVCGERRMKASIAAGLKEVPAVIRNLSDEEALEIQFIENIQRDDVHPMDEATTFKSMLESKLKPYTVADIAAKINKPEKFVTHRVSLNNLIPELQNDFWKGKFLIGHAVLFSKLSPEDQKLCAKECKEWGGKEFKKVSEVKNFIERNIIRILSAAPFKKDDPTLNPKMGPCTTCPFRSGNNPTLFDEVKETDRCFKPACFTLKLENWTLRKVETVLVEEPDLLLLSNGHDKILTAIFNKAKELNVKINKSYDDFSSYGSGPTVKGIWVSGSDIGKIEKVYLRKTDKSKAAGKNTDNKNAGNAAIDEEIAGIKQRTTRAPELDDEKVWKRIHDEVILDKALLNGDNLSKIDTAAILYAMCTSAGYNGFDKIGKFFGTTDKKKLSDIFLKVTPAQFNQASRIFIKEVLDSTMGSHSANAGQGLLKMVAEQYHKDKITTFELEQKEKRVKREARAAERIKALQAQKKETKVAQPKKKVAKK